MDALYLRGQWTVHRNTPSISTIWKGCPHLGDGLQKELLMKVAWVRRMESRGIKNYPKRFQSAEGCYSHRATLRAGIRIKVAHKQFVGLSVPSDDQVISSSRHCVTVASSVSPVVVAVGDRCVRSMHNLGPPKSSALADLCRQRCGLAVPKGGHGRCGRSAQAFYPTMLCRLAWRARASWGNATSPGHPGGGLRKVDACRVPDVRS